LSWKEYGLEGSAVMIANSESVGLLVTNKHVIAPCLDGSQVATAIVRLQDQDEFIPAKVVATGRDNRDLALLRIDLKGFFKPYALHTGRRSTLRIGESCIAIGNALGAGTGVTEGVLSQFDSIEGVSYLRTSAPVSHGNSGGALITLSDPRLIGIVNATVEEGQNFNHAIPIDYVLDDNTWTFVMGQEEAHGLFRKFQERNP
jgi:S1-C subfamily serine protease